MKPISNYISERLNPRHLGGRDVLSEELKNKYNLIYNPKTLKYDCNGDIKVEKDLIKNGYFICNFGVVDGDFDCSECKSLTSLEGAPEKVTGDFNCSECQDLISLKGSPEEVGRDFYCSHCKKLTNYTINTKIGGNFIK